MTNTLSNEIITSELVQIPEGIDKAMEFVDFCKWSAMPKEIRIPTEQKKLAEKLTVDEATLCRWKQTQEFASNRSYYIKQWIGEDLPDIMHAVKKRALRHSTADTKLLLEWLKELQNDGAYIGKQFNIQLIEGQTYVFENKKLVPEKRIYTYEDELQDFRLWGTHHPKDVKDLYREMFEKIA